MRSHMRFTQRIPADEEPTFSSLQNTQNQQPARPKKPKHPLISLPPTHASQNNIVAQPPRQRPPSCDQGAKATVALGLDGGRPGNMRVPATIATISTETKKRLGGAKHEADEDGDYGRGEG